MNKRDRAIIDDLERFRCMSRDDIAGHNSDNVSKAITAANRHRATPLSLGKIEDQRTFFQPFVFTSRR